MGVCTDSRLTYLNGLGYNVIRLPREGIEPMHALGRDLKAGSIENLGSISRTWKSDTAPPTLDPLKANAVKVVAKDKSGTIIGVDVPAIQNAVGVKVNVGSTAAGDHSVTYRGEKLVTFGFKAFGVAFMDGDWRVFGVKPAKEMSFAAGGVAMVSGGELAARANDTGILLHTGGLLDFA